MISLCSFVSLYMDFGFDYLCEIMVQRMYNVHSIEWTTQTKLYVSSLFLFCRTFYSLILPLMFVCHFVCFLSCTLPPNSSTLYSLFHFFNFVADYKIVDSRSNWWQDLGDCKSPKSRFIKIKDMFMCNKKKKKICSCVF